ncbi:hypothetical protein H4S02_011271, partial [Coemansia sp. RSA 2611]
MPKAKKVVEQYSSDEDSSGVSDAEVSYSGESSDDGRKHEEEQSDYSDDDGDDEERGDGKDAKAEKIRQQLASVPFSQLIRIQQQMGTSKFNQSMGLKEKTDTKRKVRQELKQRAGLGGDRSEEDSDAESDSDDSAPETVSTKSGKKDMHRDNRKKPAMMSSKRPVSRFRQVVDIAKPQTRDPRFDN